jgi:hypothetical protein
VRCRVADHGEFRPVCAAQEAPASAQVVDAGLVALQAGRIDGGFGALVDQAAAFSTGENSSEKRLESPLFSSRPSA